MGNGAEMKSVRPGVYSLYSLCRTPSPNKLLSGSVDRRKTEHLGELIFKATAQRLSIKSEKFLLQLSIQTNNISIKVFSQLVTNKSYTITTNTKNSTWTAPNRLQDYLSHKYVKIENTMRKYCEISNIPFFVCRLFYFPTEIGTPTFSFFNASLAQWVQEKHSKY